MKIKERLTFVHKDRLFSSVEVYTRTSNDVTQSHDGGDYTFSYTLNPINENEFIKRHYTSSDFSYCTVDGVFRECRDCPHGRPDNCDELCEIIPAEVVEKLLNSYHTNYWEGRVYVYLEKPLEEDDKPSLRDLVGDLAPQEA